MTTRHVTPSDPLNAYTQAHLAFCPECNPRYYLGRDLLAQAWEEGRQAQCGQDNGGPMAVNPYTAEAQVDGL